MKYIGIIEGGRVLGVEGQVCFIWVAVKELLLSDHNKST